MIMVKVFFKKKYWVGFFFSGLGGGGKGAKKGVQRNGLIRFMFTRNV